MLQPLKNTLSEKQKHYSSSGTGFDHLSLVVYYNSALIYNSPADDVQMAKELVIDDPCPFNSIFLFIAVGDGRALKIL